MSLLKGHPNVVTLEGVFEDKAGVHIVMELCTGGSLTDHMCSQASGDVLSDTCVLRSQPRAR